VKFNQNSQTELKRQHERSFEIKGGSPEVPVVV